MERKYKKYFFGFSGITKNLMRALIILMMVGMSDVANAMPWKTETVDTTVSNSYINQSSIAIDSSGNAHISYYDSKYGNLKYAKWNGNYWINTTVDSAENVGQFNSIVLISDKPHISYYDATNKDLKYAGWNGSTWNIEIIDSVGDVGKYTSIARWDSSTQISYYDATNGNLKIAAHGCLPQFIYTCKDIYVWNNWTVDTTGNTGLHTSIAVADSYPYISYYDSNGNLKYASIAYDCSDFPCTQKFFNQIVDPNGDMPGGTSIAIDSNGKPHISYVNRSMFVKYASRTGAQWSSELVSIEHSGAVSMSLDSSDQPHMSLVECVITWEGGTCPDPENSYLYYVKKWGNKWNITWLDSGPGYHSDISVDPDGKTRISYYNALNGSLKQASYSPSSPVISNVLLSSSYGTNTINENLTLTWNAYDGEGDSIKNITNWYRNEIPIAVVNMPFEGGSNLTFTKDYSGNGNHGVVNGTSWDPTGGYDRFGAYEFDGINDYIQSERNINISSNSTRTLAFWAKPYDTSISGLVGWGRDGIGQHFEAGIRNNHWFLWGFGAGKDWDTGVTPQINVWSHHAITYNGTVARWFVNGQELGSGMQVAYNTANTPLYIGINNNQGIINYFGGMIDDLQAYDHALSPEQITSLFRNRSDLIVSREISAGDIWQASITPNDGNEDGENRFSNSLRIIKPSQIGTCSVITKPGVYELITDLVGSSSGCITITSSDVIIDGVGHRIIGPNSYNGISVHNSTKILTNVTVRNLLVTNWSNGIYFKRIENGRIENVNSTLNYYGIYIESSNYMNLTENKANNNNRDGIYLLYSDNNIIEKNTVEMNKNDGIVLYNSSHYNDIFYNNVNMNGASGIVIRYSNDTHLDNNIANSNRDGYLIYLNSNRNNLTGNEASLNREYAFALTSSSNNNTLTGNIANRSGVSGISIMNSNDNVIYNNYFNNNVNVTFSGTTSNIWNTQLQKISGKNIVGRSVLGGNFWARPNGKGFSQTCAYESLSYPEICAEGYMLDSSNIDYYPLTRGPILIDSCTDIVLPGTYMLKNSIDARDVMTSCINIKSNDVILDGRNYAIYGEPNSFSSGVYVNNPLKMISRITIINLTVMGWNKGIEVQNVSVIHSSKNNLTSNYYGIYLNYTYGSFLAGNYILENSYGLHISNSIHNILESNQIIRNYDGMELGIGSNNNTLIKNNICRNEISDITNRDTSNTGWLNRCSNSVNWNDEGDDQLTGCSQQCVGNYPYNYGLAYPNYGTGELSYPFDPNQEGNFKDVFGADQIYGGVKCIGIEVCVPGSDCYCAGVETKVYLFPDPIAWMFYEAQFKKGAENGQCMGFSAKSLDFFYRMRDNTFENYIYPSDYDPYARLPKELADEGKLQRSIQNLQATQYTAEIITYFKNFYINGHNKNPNWVLNEIKSDLEYNDHGILTIRNPSAGHAVVVDTYHENLYTNITRVYVYDNNDNEFVNNYYTYDDQYPYIEINGNTNTFNFEFIPGEYWSEDIGYIPYSYFKDLRTGPWRMEGILEILLFGSELVKDKDGNKFGTDASGNKYSEITNATEIPVFMNSNNGSRMFALPFGDYQFEVYGNQSNNYSRYFFNKDVLYAIENVSSEQGTKDHINLVFEDNNSMTGALQLSTDDTKKTFSATIIKEFDNRAERVYRIINSDLYKGDNVTIRTTPDFSGIVFTNRGSHTLTYDVEVSTSLLGSDDNINKIPTLKKEKLTVLPMTSQEVAPDNWQNLSVQEMIITSSSCGDNMCSSYENFLTCPEDCSKETCIEPYDDMEVNSNTKLCYGNYSINDRGNNGVIIINNDSVELDCIGATLRGNGTGIGIGFTDKISHAKVSNCKILNYREGISLQKRVNESEFFHNIIGENTGEGISLNQSGNNSIFENIIKNNTIGILFENSEKNQLTSNRICDNDLSDVQIDRQEENKGTGNVCDKNDGWNDASYNTCTYRCSPTGILPVADCGANKIKCENVGTQVQFNGSKSYDPDGAIVSYYWDFGDGTNATGLSPFKTYASYRWNGTAYLPFIVNLTVTDNSGSKGSASQNVTIWMAGDANGDGIVNILDAAVVGLKWGSNDPCADLNNDGVVNILDASIIGLNWGKSPIVGG